MELESSLAREFQKLTSGEIAVHPGEVLKWESSVGRVSTIRGMHVSLLMHTELSLPVKGSKTRK